MSRRIARTTARKEHADAGSKNELRLSETETLALFVPWITPDTEAVVQQVKGDLFNRNYMEAFSTEDKRQAYAARWSSSRTGAELVALGSVFGRLLETLPISSTARSWHVTAVDISDWSSVVRKIAAYVTDQWVRPRLVSAQHSLALEFVLEDVLQLPANVTHRLHAADLITCCFTTNELFAENKTQAIALLNRLSECRAGTLFLVLESAGSYSHITVGSKRFPVYFLVDTVLCGPPGRARDWELVSSSDSEWYRVPGGVEYPLKLENMRFFYRLYRRR
ncbi:hypothetical protein KL921_004608 [Ogataea angusta]|uniref:Uncharacterized protein n=1 Tax=Pichia angusta TaxID=870730 RepID=A0AAN6DAQ9_PICAN|nr:uncharacterized protein KL928_004997 [Ogataea angusta]KAG7806814.1 hypothetical protein KL921_004608 [Ogataea angusta]KAG7816031.1 hypothetical protein KL928_004997 [Ogataea angusta]KAG7821492.1 hypothetical protein KL909_004379 [Ogataea angusta]KAG7827232.1 hypothetical protein KL920_004892 [Ogataea angusta]KAG7829348.1 hypothetical protein KL943_005361 [Ogataea angusta]